MTKAEPGYEGTQWLFVLDIVGSDLSMAKRQMSIIDFRLFTVAMILGLNIKHNSLQAAQLSSNF